MPKRFLIKPEDLIGQRYHMLEIIGYVEKTESYKHIVMVRCDCGEVKKVDLAAMRRNLTKSCGCYSRGLAKQSSYNKTHGLSKHSLYRVWCGMINRCYNESDRAFKSYGAKDVSVCEEWRNDFVCFYNWAINNGWQKGLELDKDKLAKDYAGMLYSPDFCCFITPQENQLYKRGVPWIEYKDERHNLVEWAKILNLDRTLLFDRYNRGWSAIEMFEKPKVTPRLILFNDMEKSLNDWAVFLGMDYKALHARISDGWTYEKALSTPIKKIKKRNQYV